MPISWNEIRHRGIAFANEWKNKLEGGRVHSRHADYCGLRFDQFD